MQLRNKVCRFLITFWFMFLLSANSFGKGRFSAGLGLGSTTSSNEVSVSEGPLTQMYTVEFVLHSRLVYGVEHLRSLQVSPLSTAISFTGVFANYYFSSVPVPYVKAEELSSANITFRDVGYFAGVGLGLAQGSRLPDSDGKASNAAGIYLSPRAGVEIQLNRELGFRSSLQLGMLMVGEGSLSSVSLLQSVYYNF